MFIYINTKQKKEFDFNEPGDHAVFFNNLEGDLTFRLKHPGVRLAIFGLYDINGTARYSLKTIQHHLAPGTESNLLIKSVVAEKGAFMFDGLIQIDKTAQQSNAYQKNQNLIMSSDAYVLSRPTLEIKADDVKCTHGSTTGTVDERSLYYLMTRGMSQVRAQNMFIAGFLNDVFLRLQTNTESATLTHIRKDIMMPYEKT